MRAAVGAVVLLAMSSTGWTSEADTLASLCVADSDQTAVPVVGGGSVVYNYKCRPEGYPKIDLDDPTMYRVKANDYFLLRFFKNDANKTQTTLADGGLVEGDDSVVIYYGKENHRHTFHLTRNDLSSNQKVFFLIGLADAAENGDVLTVQLKGRDPLYYRWRRPFGLYNNRAGFWIPIGLLSTNFAIGDNGVTLAPMPIGLAWGVKVYYNDVFFGFSLAFNYTIHPINDATGKATGGYSFTSFTPAALIDFDGYVYAGYGYGLRFDDISQSPGSLFIVGIGPALLSILKDKS